LSQQWYVVEVVLPVVALLFIPKRTFLIIYYVFRHCCRLKFGASLSSALKHGYLPGPLVVRAALENRF